MFRSARWPVLACLAAVCLAAAFSPVSIRAATEATPVPDAADAQQAAEQLVHGLHYRQGEITLQGGTARLNVPDTFHFLDAADARKVLVDLWGNPPEAANKVLGMLVPAAAAPDQEQSYGVIITYDGSGYVKDDDAEKIDYTSMLKDMQKATHGPQRRAHQGGLPRDGTRRLGRAAALRPCHEETLLGQGVAGGRPCRPRAEL